MLAQQESQIPGSLRTEIGTNIHKHKTTQLGCASGKSKISASCLLLTIRNAKWCFGAQSIGEDLGQTGMLPGKSIFATWLRQGPRPWPFSTASKQRGQQAPHSHIFSTAPSSTMRTKVAQLCYINTDLEHRQLSSARRGSLG